MSRTELAVAVVLGGLAVALVVSLLVMCSGLLTGGR